MPYIGEFGLIIDNVKYLPLMDTSSSSLKTKSSQDNIYFTH